MNCTPAVKSIYPGRERPTQPELEAEMERPSTTEELRTQVLERTTQTRRRDEVPADGFVLGRYRLSAGWARAATAWCGRRGTSGSSAMWP